MPERNPNQAPEGTYELLDTLYTQSGGYNHLTKEPQIELRDGSLGFLLNRTPRVPGTFREDGSSAEVWVAAYEKIPGARELRGSAWINKRNEVVRANINELGLGEDVTQERAVERMMDIVNRTLKGFNGNGGIVTFLPNLPNT